MFYPGSPTNDQFVNQLYNEIFNDADDDWELPPHWPDHPDATPIPDYSPSLDGDPVVDDPGGSGNSQRAKYCRGKCSKILDRGGFTAEFDFRNCLRNCMQDPDACI